MKQQDLAVYKYKDHIIEAVQENQVVVIEAPTGSGKTTQIPQILFNAGMNGWGMIGVTQPRRIAAFGVSSRIAGEMDVELGQLVGYKMRFDDFTSEQTKIKIMTDGILLEELRNDPDLMQYSIIMVDEAHERSLNIDFVLGLLKDILARRDDIRIVISSATINAKLFSDYFNNAPVISVETSPYPIEEKYLPLKKPEDFNELQDSIEKIVTGLQERNEAGDVLIFLHGEAAIKECCSRLEVVNINTGYDMEILPIYSRLAPEEQNRVFDEFPGKRKVVIATNIAETSITIDGIIHVIDPGFCKLNYYNPRTFTSFLETRMISRASSDQRRGRAGRTAPGVVYRLYSRDNYMEREEYTREEIYRTDLSEVVLRMADLGILDFLSFDFISKPSKGAIYSAIETLIMIGALNSNNSLTDLGRRMVDFPLGPRLSRILLEGVMNYPAVTDNLLIIISFLSTKTPFLFPPGEEIESRQAQKRLSERGGDFFSWINLFKRYLKAKDKEAFCNEYYLDPRSTKEIVKIHDQLVDMMRDRDYPVNKRFDYNKIVTCLCAGLIQYLCVRDKKKQGTYHSVTERQIRIHPGSYLYKERPEWLIGGEIVNTGRTYLRSAAVVPEQVIKQSFNSVYNDLVKKQTNTRRTFLETAPKKREKKQSQPDRIEVLDKYFDFRKDKKGRFLYVPYQILIQLKSRKEKLLGQDFGKIKARLYHKDAFILKDSFSSLIHYFDKIDLSQGINNRWPRDEFILYPDDWMTLYNNLPNLMKPTRSKRKSRRAGFLTLQQSSKSVYSFFLEHDFFNALEQNIDALEILFEESIPAWTDTEKQVIEKVYHKLLALAEELDQ
jgi:ATP-dependent helicase HrpA